MQRSVQNLAYVVVIDTWPTFENQNQSLVAIYIEQGLKGQAYKQRDQRS